MSHQQQSWNRPGGGYHQNSFNLSSGANVYQFQLQLHQPGTYNVNFNGYNCWDGSPNSAGRGAYYAPASRSLNGIVAPYASAPNLNMGFPTGTTQRQQEPGKWQSYRVGSSMPATPSGPPPPPTYLSRSLQNSP